MVRRCLVLLSIFTVGVCGAVAQKVVEGPDFPPYPEERIQFSQKQKTLPLRVDNSTLEYFPPIIDQLGWSCNQASSIGYLLTYELNRKRELDGEFPENQYSPSYAWNFLNGGNPSTGVSYFDTWEIIKSNGCPNIVDFPYTNASEVWMNGYDKYYRAMKNKVVKNWSISVATPDGLRVLKTFLFNHNDSFRFGGLANIQIASSGMFLDRLPADSYDGGASFIRTFGTNVGHALTVVGYNDQVKYDYNGDGLYTNNMDLNDDGVVDMADWEVGALVVVNSWGKNWGDRGKAYLPYRLLTRYGYEGGIWNRSVHVVDVLHNYAPALTLKLELVHSARNMLKISLGCSRDPEATYPDFIYEFPMLNFTGSGSGLGMNEADQHFEMGLDITPVLAHLQPDHPVRFFVMINERDPSDQGGGTVFSYSILHYSETDTTEFRESGGFPILSNQTTLFPINAELHYDPIEVADYQVMYTAANQWLSIPLYAGGVTGGASWEVVPDYKEDTLRMSYPKTDGEFMPFYTATNGFLKLDLPFDFPIYGENYRTLYADESGSLFVEPVYVDYPYSIDKNLIYKQRMSITPFGYTLSFYENDDGIYLATTDSTVRIEWVCSAQLGFSYFPFRFSCYLYPDGRIEFHYDGSQMDGPSRAVHRGGLSRGNGKQVFATTSSTLGILFPNQLIRLTPYRIPPKTKIESNSYILTRPEEKNTFYEIRIRVSDQNYKEAYGIVPISTIDFSSLELTASSSPNPFTESTEISFVVQEKAQVQAVIYDLEGKLIKTFPSQEFEKGFQKLIWDGRSDQGSSCPAGVYTFRIFIGDEKQSVKIIKNAC